MRISACAERVSNTGVDARRGEMARRSTSGGMLTVESQFRRLRAAGSYCTCWSRATPSTAREGARSRSNVPVTTRAQSPTRSVREVGSDGRGCRAVHVHISVRTWRSQPRRTRPGSRPRWCRARGRSSRTHRQIRGGMDPADQFVGSRRRHASQHDRELVVVDERHIVVSAGAGAERFSGLDDVPVTGQMPASAVLAARRAASVVTSSALRVEAPCFERLRKSRPVCDDGVEPGSWPMRAGSVSRFVGPPRRAVSGRSLSEVVTHSGASAARRRPEAGVNLDSFPFIA